MTRQTPITLMLFNASKSRPFGFVVLLTFLISVLTAGAQDIVAPRPEGDLVPAALQQALAAQNASTNASVPASEPEMPLFQWGLATVRANLSYRYLYGDGIPAASGQHLTTSINNVSPDFMVELGTHWTVDYSPAWIFYSNAAFNNTVDESLRLAGWGTYEDWILKISAGYQTSSYPTVETGRQTKQSTSSTSFSATYSINSKLGLELTAMQAFQSAETFTSSHDWSTMDWLHYRIVSTLDTAVGLGVGYVTVSQGSDMTYTKPQAEVTWTATDKITLGIQGGEESRRSLGTNGATQNNPIYGANLQYRPFEVTTLALAATRQVSASYLESEITRSTGWNASLQQRLLEKFYLSANVSHQKVAYVSSLNGAATPRNDDEYTYNVRLSTVLFRRCSVAAVYQTTRNSSAVVGYGLSSRQVGVEIGFRF